MSAEIRAWFDDHQKKLRNEGTQLAVAAASCAIGELPAAIVARIEAADMADLERWGEYVLGAQTLAEVLPNRAEGNRAGRPPRRLRRENDGRARANSPDLHVGCRATTRPPPEPSARLTSIRHWLTLSQ